MEEENNRPAEKGQIEMDNDSEHPDRLQEENNSNTVDSTISSSSVEGGIVKGGHTLRSRVPGRADAWRELSRTPPPAGSSTRSYSSDAKHRRAQYQNPDKQGRSFTDLSKEFEEKQKKVAEKGVRNKNTVDDFSYTGLKRNKPSGFKRKFNYLLARFMALPSMYRNGFAFVLVGLLVAGLLLCRGSTESEENTSRISWNKAQASLLKEVVKVSKDFPAQNRETVIHFISAINTTLSEKEPKQPSAIVILTPPSMKGSRFPTCYISKFSSIVNRLFGKVLNLTGLHPTKILDKTYFKNNGANITAIHEDLKLYLSKKGKAVLVHDVDQLDKEEHLLFFHSFCDNFKAPDKRATFFFIVPVPAVIHQKYSWNQMFAADISNDVLDRAWENVISDDSRPAMISRVAATVVLLNDGDSCS